MSKYLNILLFSLMAFMGCSDIREDIYIIFDTTPPVVSIEEPNGGDEVSGIVSVEVLANDNDKLEKVELYTSVNGLEGTSTLDAFVHIFDWNSTTIDNGECGLYAVAYDKSGNSTISETIQVTAFNMVTLNLNNLTQTDVAFQFGQGANPSVEAVVPVGGNDTRAENGMLPTRVFEKTDEEVDFSIFD